MKIALIGPGIMPIPPPGWGAVEILIWDYKLELVAQGHEVDIINPIRNSSHDQSNPTTIYCKKIIDQVNSTHYDFVHIHYDCLYHIMPFLKCGNVGITSHYPYIDQLNKHRGDGYNIPFKHMCNNLNHTIFALSQKDFDVFHAFSVDKTKIKLLLNGANENEIQPIEVDNKIHKSKSVYIGKIEERKQQYKYCKIPNIDYYGKCDNIGFSQLSCFKGEIEHSQLMKILPQYGNLILLSTGENGTPLVIKEALMAGLPIVTNRFCISDIDVNLPFVDIIPDDKLNDLDYIETVIAQNLKKQCLQKDIREYAMKHFSWKSLVMQYVEKIRVISKIGV